MEEIKGKSLNVLCIGLFVTKEFKLPLSDLEFFGLTLTGVEDDQLKLLLWIAFGFYLIRYIQRLPGLIGNFLDDFLREKKWDYIFEIPITSPLKDITLTRVKRLQFVPTEIKGYTKDSGTMNMSGIKNFWKRFIWFSITRQYFLNYFLAVFLVVGLLVYYLFF